MTMIIIINTLNETLDLWIIRVYSQKDFIQISSCTHKFQKYAIGLAHGLYKFNNNVTGCRESKFFWGLYCVYTLFYMPMWRNCLLPCENIFFL